jgi:hypothetical protein
MSEVEALAALNAWRSLSAEDQAAHFAAKSPPTPLDLRLAMEADLCPHGSGPCGCGPEPRVCGHPDRPTLVRRGDCLGCLARDWWEAGVEGR